MEVSGFCVFSTREAGPGIVGINSSETLANLRNNLSKHRSHRSCRYPHGLLSEPDFHKGFFHRQRSMDGFDLGCLVQHVEGDLHVFIRLKAILKAARR